MTSCPQCGRAFEEGVRYCPADGVLLTTLPAPSSPAADSHLGRILDGQLEILQVAGRGAMGTVYRARQRPIDRQVAVKVLRRDLVAEPGVLKRFVREARASAQLQHPNIVTVHLVGQTEEGLPYLVMEYIDGASLEDICEAQGAQPTARTLVLTRQIASALAEAHQHGIVHRDLKPANILVTDRSRVPDLVKVLDFGIAKIVQGQMAGESQITRDGTIFGTPHYMAPEQASGIEIDHRADIYSLGVILFRLITGRLPFEGAASMQVVLKHLREQPPRPRALAPATPERLEALVLACLAKDRQERPADAEAVMAELDQIEAELPAPSTQRALHSVTAHTTAKLRAMPILPSPSPPRRTWWRAVTAIGLGATVGVVAALVTQEAPAARTPAAAVSDSSDPPSRAAPGVPPSVEAARAESAPAHVAPGQAPSGRTVQRAGDRRGPGRDVRRARPRHDLPVTIVRPEGERGRPLATPSAEPSPTTRTVIDHPQPLAPALSDPPSSTDPAAGAPGSAPPASSNPTTIPPPPPSS